MHNAWLIGVYTIETECRIEDLGYSLSHVFATPSLIDSSLSAPDLIVFADDGLNNLDEMETLRYVFPSALIISVAANHIFWEDCLTFAERRSSEQSVARLLYQIHEREHRWDN
jgi:hypothetical protein